MANYGNRQASTQVGKTGGYKPSLYFAPASDIATYGRPAASPVALGDKVKVTTAHTFATGKAANLWDAKLHSVTHTSKPVGDPGSLEMEHTVVVTFLGDNPATFEQVQNMLNDQVVIWVKDADCLTNDSYIQLGNDCIPVDVSPEFDGKNTQAGQKEYKITFTSKAKVFYVATLDINA
jgi:hypothetical protein